MILKEKLIKKLKNKGYFGIDTSLDISLFEYGLLIKAFEPNVYQVIYCINGETNNPTFAMTIISEIDIIDILDEYKDEILRYTGSNSIDTWFDQPMALRLHDLYLYIGYPDQIFYETYNHFSLEEFIEKDI